MDEETRPDLEIKQTITLPGGEVFRWLGDPTPAGNPDATTTGLAIDSDDEPILDPEQQALHARMMSPGTLATDADDGILDLTEDMLVREQGEGAEAAGTAEVLMENGDTAVSAMLMPEKPSFFRTKPDVTDPDAPSTASAEAIRATWFERPDWFSVHRLTNLLPSSLPQLQRKYVIGIAVCAMLVLSGFVGLRFVPKTEKSEPLLVIETTPSSKAGLRLVGNPDKLALGIDQHVKGGVGKRLTEVEEALQARIESQQEAIGTLQAQLTAAQGKIKALEEDTVRLNNLVRQLNESNINADDVVAALEKLRGSPGS